MQSKAQFSQASYNRQAWLVPNLPQAFPPSRRNSVSQLGFEVPDFGHFSLDLNFLASTQPLSRWSSYSTLPQAPEPPTMAARVRASFPRNERSKGPKAFVPSMAKTSPTLTFRSLAEESPSSTLQSFRGSTAALSLSSSFTLVSPQPSLGRKSLDELAPAPSKPSLLDLSGLSKTMANAFKKVAGAIRKPNSAAEKPKKTRASSVAFKNALVFVAPLSPLTKPVA